MAIATLKTAFVLQAHIYFLPNSVINIEKMFAVYTDCTLITIKLSIVKYLSKIRRQIIDYCPAVYFISEPTNFIDLIFFVNYTYINIIILIIIIIITTIFDISVPLTSEMIATPLPCNI